MKIIKVTDAIAGGKIAYDIFREKVLTGIKVLGLATGSTPEELYKQIVASNLDLSNLISVNLDEYVGLSAQDEQSYAYFMHKHLFDKKPLKASYLPKGLAADPTAEAERYNQLLSEYPVDLQVLGLGRNGHIGFNEPGTAFDSVTRVVDLEPSTIAANARFFEDESQVPRQAFSMGIANIMSAKTILLMAYGEAKADAVYGMIEGPITESLPASILQQHPDVIVIVDKAAASRLS